MYPHPVMGIGDDLSDAIEIDLNIASDGKEISITPAFKLTNEDLQELLDKNKALFTSHVYCRGTMYRNVFKTTKPIPEAIKISSEKLSGEVEIDFFICANENIAKYTNATFNSDYKGHSFSVDKGDILAYAGKGKFYANKSPEELTSISALMNISSTGKDSHTMFNEYSGDKITIMLCQQDYENYQIIKNSPSLWWNVLLSCIVLPALTETLHYLSSLESQEFSQRRWHQVLTEYKNKSKEPTEVQVAQRILDLPNNRSFNAMKQLIEEQ
jgi:hypothetical protein